MIFGNALVIGLGEVGTPLAEILESRYRTYRKDIAPLEISEPIDVVHICYAYKGHDFVETTVEYVKQYRPRLVIIHSTVVPGITRAVFERSGVPTAYSAVRGRHVQMKQDMLSYTKYAAGVTEEATLSAVQHLQAAGLRTGAFSSPDALELAKLLETTYSGILLAWTQEMERYCRSAKSDYYEVMQFMAEISYLPPVVFQPGYIGGHCIMPNAYLLDQLKPSLFTDLMRQSNEQKAQEWIAEGRDLNERLTALPVKQGAAYARSNDKLASSRLLD